MDPTEATRILEQELERGRALIAAARSVEDLDEAKTAVLGRKAPIASVQSSIGSMPGDARRDLGRRTNEAFAELRSQLDARRAELEEGAEDELLRADAVDVTLPGRGPRPRSLRPRDRARGGRGGGPAPGGRGRRHPARPAPAAELAPPAQPRAGPDRRDLHADGVSGGRPPRDRRRVARTRG